MNYPDSVRFLYSIGNEIKTAKLGLERIKLLLAALGNPQGSCKFVHVAGTNGKGSTCAMIESGLRAAGVRTGLFISPHLVEPTERIQVGGEPVSAALFAQAFDCVHKLAERLLREGSLDYHPTYFETVTAMAFLLFRDLQVEMGVLEVGLGGRLDATNVVTPELCVITPVDFDHEALLGATIEAIANEKAGILKAGVPAVLSRQRTEAAQTINRRAQELAVGTTNTASWTLQALELHTRGSRFAAVGGREFHIVCPLAGEHQVENALTAAVALDRLNMPAGAIERGIRETRWPARLECVAENPEIILDGAHNPAGAQALAAYIRRFYGDKRIWMIFGALRDKSIEEMAGALFPLVDQLIVTAPASERAVTPESLLEIYDHPGTRVAKNVSEALAMIGHAAPDEVVFITGSLFLAGEARTLLVQ